MIMSLIDCQLALFSCPKQFGIAAIKRTGINPWFLNEFHRHNAYLRVIKINLKFCINIQIFIPMKTLNLYQYTNSVPI